MYHTDLLQINHYSIDLKVNILSSLSYPKSFGFGQHVSIDINENWHTAMLTRLTDHIKVRSQIMKDEAFSLNQASGVVNIWCSMYKERKIRNIKNFIIISKRETYIGFN